ncbi:MAG: hypothetical protein QXH26_04960 [Candidatus Hadarchaeales archaeon]
MQRIKCHICGYVWAYKGSGRFYATCPRCLRKVKLADPGGRHGA